MLFIRSGHVGIGYEIHGVWCPTSVYCKDMLCCHTSPLLFFPTSAHLSSTVPLALEEESLYFPRVWKVGWSHWER